jgi:hypothetical protein
VLPWFWPGGVPLAPWELGAASSDALLSPPDPPPEWSDASGGSWCSVGSVGSVDSVGLVGSPVLELGAAAVTGGESSVPPVAPAAWVPGLSVSFASLASVAEWPLPEDVGLAVTAVVAAPSVGDPLPAPAAAPTPTVPSASATTAAIVILFLMFIEILTPSCVVLGIHKHGAAHVKPRCDGNESSLTEPKGQVFGRAEASMPLGTFGPATTLPLALQ